MDILLANQELIWLQDILDEITAAKKRGIILPTVIEELKKYSKKGYYVHFSDINKVGINPKSDWKTPLGFYTYILNDSFIDEFINGKVPFASNRKLAIVVKPKPGKKLLDIYGKNRSNLSKENFVKALVRFFSDKSFRKYCKEKPYEHFKEYFFSPSQLENIDLIEILDDEEILIFEQWLNEARGKSVLTKAQKAHFAKRIAARKEARKKAAKKVERIKIDPGYFIAQLKDYVKTSDNYASYLYRVVDLLAKDMIRKTRIFRELGFNGVIDRGTGTIHHNEPAQAVFFSKEAISTVDVFENTHQPSAIHSKKVIGQIRYYKQKFINLFKKGMPFPGDIIKFKPDFIKKRKVYIPGDVVKLTRAGAEKVYNELRAQGVEVKLHEIFGKKVSVTGINEIIYSGTKLPISIQYSKLMAFFSDKSGGDKWLKNAKMKVSMYTADQLQIGKRGEIFSAVSSDAVVHFGPVFGENDIFVQFPNDSVEVAKRGNFIKTAFED